jgi:hypothetical protein
MGSHLMKRPPKFVQAFLDRHGNPRFYFSSPWLQKCSAAGVALVAGIYGRL